MVILCRLTRVGAHKKSFEDYQCDNARRQNHDPEEGGKNAEKEANLIHVASVDPVRFIEDMKR